MALFRDPGVTLRDGARRQRLDTGRNEVEVLNDVDDGAIAEQRHADDEPHDLVGRQLPPPNRRLARERQGLLDPLRVERRLEAREAAWPHRRKIIQDFGEALQALRMVLTNRSGYPPRRESGLI